MKTSFVILLSFTISLVVNSQPYYVGSRQISFTDPARSRTIATRVYHPATSAGSNKPFATGTFPLIILGHGFSMSYDAYLNFADSLVPLGYIVVMPTTEVGPIPFPNHENFALDLRFLNSKIKTENSLSTSVFYQHVASESAIMGHSMGGGCTFLACENNADVTALITFAPAETDVSAISAALNVSVPALVFSGANDGVTPPADNHIPMYNNLASDCKTFVSINGGGHCYYALSNWACDFGESTSNPQPTITREEQQVIVFNLLIPYLDYVLKNNTGSYTTFMSRLQNNSDITYQHDCLSNVLYPDRRICNIYPNPAADFLFLTDEMHSEYKYRICDPLGRCVVNSVSESGKIDISTLKEGVYYLTITADNSEALYKFIKVR